MKTTRCFVTQHGCCWGFTGMATGSALQPACRLHCWAGLLLSGLSQRLLQGMTMGPATSLIFSSPYISRTSASANSNAVPGPLRQHQAVGGT